MFTSYISRWIDGCSVIESHVRRFSFSPAWTNLITMYGTVNTQESVRIDIRAAYGNVERENLIDFIDYEFVSGTYNRHSEQYYIIYFGYFNEEISSDLVPGNFIIDKSCKKVSHIYINQGNDPGIMELLRSNFPAEIDRLGTIDRVTERSDLSGNSLKFGLRTKGIIKKDLPGLPLISVIIPTFNSEKIIEQAIQSALVQKYENKEILIIDGGSRDGTESVVKKYEDYIDLFNSEKDKNIFDAINKGTYLSGGTYSVFIGSDDLLVYNALEKVAEESRLNGEKDFYYGNGITLTQGGSIKRDHCFISGKNFSEFKIYHPSLYIRKETFTELKGFNDEFFISADLDFELKLITMKKSYAKIEDYLCIYRGGGHSSRFLWKKIKQVRAILKNYNSINVTYFLFVLRLIFIIYFKRLIGAGLFNKIASLRYRGTINHIKKGS